MADTEKIKVRVEISKEEIQRIVEEARNECLSGMPDDLWGVVNDFVCTMRRNIEIADNNYTKWGYEIALDILKSILEERGYDTKEFFPEEEE